MKLNTIDSAVTVFKKHNEMIVMRPTSKRLTLLSRRLYYLLLADAQNKMNGVEPQGSYLFEAPLLDLLKNTKSFESGFTLTKKYFREMLDCKVEWETTNENNKKRWSGMPLLSEAHIYSKDGRDFISWAFPPSIIGMILKPDVYSILNLAILKEIDSYVGLALYDICSRYRDNPSGVTSKCSIQWWVESLSQSPLDSSVEVNWRAFKAKKLTSAIEEINNCTDITIEMFEYKVKNKITEVQFGVKRKLTGDFISDDKPFDIKKLAVIKTLADRYGMQMQTLTVLIKRHGENLVIEKFHQLEDRINNKALSPVEDNYHYLRSILSNHNYNLVEASSAPPPTPPLLTINDEISSTGPKPPTKEQQIRDEFNSLPIEERVAWIAQSANDLKARNLLTKRDEKKAENGTISPGVLGSEVVAIYAKSTKGESWLAS